MNATEVSLLELAGKAVDQRCMSRFQKLAASVSLHGFLTGVILTVIISSLAVIVSRIQHVPTNLGTIFIVGIFVTTTRVSKFASFTMVVGSIISYYLLFYRWYQGLFAGWPFVIGLFVFSLLAFGVYTYVRMSIDRLAGIEQGIVRAAFKAAAPEKMQEVVRLPSCN